MIDEPDWAKLGRERPERHGGDGRMTKIVLTDNHSVLTDADIEAVSEKAVDAMEFDSMFVVKDTAGKLYAINPAHVIALEEE